MQTRIPFVPAKFEAVYRAMAGLGAAVRASGLEQPLIELVRLRVSQLNGCGYCIDMHSKDARGAGETEQRLYLLQAWREAPMFTDRERAALGWAEAVTLLTDHHVPDALYDQVKAAFSETEMMALTLAIIEINGWNRISISLNAVPGSYRVGQHS
jgi:AhpD family alkylhydroperoxidase